MYDVEDKAYLVFIYFNRRIYLISREQSNAIEKLVRTVNTCTYMYMCAMYSTYVLYFHSFGLFLLSSFSPFYFSLPSPFSFCLPLLSSPPFLSPFSFSSSPPSLSSSLSPPPSLLSSLSSPDTIDIVNDALVGSDYKEEEDPSLYVSNKTGRGPLPDDWITNPPSGVIMCSYKLIKV